MEEPKIPTNEQERLEALDSYNILDSLPESDYDDITELASLICGTPISLISLIDSKRQFFKSSKGLEATETPRKYSFCAHAINKPHELMQISDARKDERFHDNPFVTGDPNIVFYAGMPLVDENGVGLGTLCVLDQKPKELSKDQLSALEALSRKVTSLLKLRKRTRELEEKNQRIKKLISTITHDLNSPLSTIYSIYEAMEMEEGIENIPNMTTYLEMGKSVSERMIRLVKNMLEADQFDHKPLEFSAVDLNVIIKNVLQNLDADIKKSNASIVIKEKLPVVKGNSLALERVFQNLISNANKFVDDNTTPEIIISSKENKVAWEISITDNGIGIPEDKQKKIFRSFSRINVAKKYPGSGLGLTVCKKMVKKIGGNISVASEPGEGSCFTITLPKI